MPTQDDLCGHADNSAGAGYVHDGSVEAMKEAIEKLRFDSFVLGTGVAGHLADAMHLSSQFILARRSKHQNKLRPATERAIFRRQIWLILAPMQHRGFHP